MGKTYLIVFHGYVNNGRIYDHGDDPCFDSIPSWGICRPNYRKSVKPNDTLIFLAKIENNYYLKGWFDVAEKIDYITALKRFPNRKNVIISEAQSQHTVEWRDRSAENLYQNLHGNESPNYLFSLKATEGIFYQNQTDEHEIDNWKCKRIFHCQYKQLKECIVENVCLKENISLRREEYKNYIVSDPKHWEDLGHLLINWNEIKEAIQFEKSLITPYNQHNVLRFDEFKNKFFDFITFKKI